MGTPVIEIDPATVEHMIANGSSMADVAEFYGCSEQTLRNRRERDPEFDALCKRAHAMYAGSKGKGVARINPAAASEALPRWERAALERAERRERFEREVESAKRIVRTALSDGVLREGDDGTLRLDRELSRQDIRRATDLDYAKIEDALYFLELDGAVCRAPDRGTIEYFTLKGKK